ncbi:unnamed protein product, partial [Leptidea sinapis]
MSLKNLSLFQPLSKNMVYHHRQTTPMKAPPSALSRSISKSAETLVGTTRHGKELKTRKARSTEKPAAAIAKGTSSLGLPALAKWNGDDDSLKSRNGRVRPPNDKERSLRERNMLEFPGKGQIICNGSGPGQKPKVFSYNVVFEPAATQVENGTSPYSEEHGLVVRSFVYLFNLIRDQPESHFILKASFLEIYNEKVIDLLNPGSARKPLQVRWSKESRSFYVENLFMVDCEELDDLFAVLEEGMRNRAVGSHAMNSNSSRSHTLLSVRVRRDIRSEGDVTCSTHGKINFVDLAGSEMTKRTNSTGKTLEEANNINKSLMVL